MEKLTLAVESDYLGSASAQVVVLLNAETDIGQRLSCLITELQRFCGNLFAVGLSGHNIDGWTSEWINHDNIGRSLLKILFVKPRARKVNAGAFTNYVNDKGELFVRQLELTLESAMVERREELNKRLAEAVESARTDAVSGMCKDIRRQAMTDCDVYGLLKLLMVDLRNAAKATTAAERQAILDKHVAYQVDRLSKLSYLEGVPREEIEAALKMTAPTTLPDWIGQLTLLNL